MKYLVAGLGNPGQRYEYTRHNIGFQVVDLVAKQCNASFSYCKLGHLAYAQHGGADITLLKPDTYMNHSGLAIRHWLAELALPLTQLLIIADDIRLPVGVIRLRAQGGAGGHNGLKNIEQLLGTNTYARLRLGVGDDFAPGEQSEYVLARFTSTEQAIIQASVERAAAAVFDYCV